MIKFRLNVLIVLFVFIQSYALKAQVELEDIYAVKVTINVQTTVPVESDRDPAPVYKESKQISGTVVGRAIMGTMEKIASDKNAWGQLGSVGTATVFTGHSNFKLRDEEDYSKIAYEVKYPIRVHMDKMEMDYVGTGNDERYTRVSEFKAQGLNEVEAIALTIKPYHPLTAIPPVEPHYVVMLAISRYIGNMSAKPEGNGHDLKWDYNEEKLVPTNNPLNISVLGTLTQDDPPEGVKPVITRARDFNDFFLGGGKGSLTLDLIGSSFEPENSNRSRNISVTLEFYKIPSVLAMPLPADSTPHLEDWDWY